MSKCKSINKNIDKIEKTKNIDKEIDKIVKSKIVLRREEYMKKRPRRYVFLCNLFRNSKYGEKFDSFILGYHEYTLPFDPANIESCQLVRLLVVEEFKHWLRTGKYL